MGDLISRSAVIDVLKQTGIIQDNDLGHLVVDEINRMPTAYDIEKVVAELEEEGKCYARYSVNTDGVKSIPTYKAINIVRKGGIDK